MNVTLKYMPQTKKVKECRGFMAMKLDIRKGSPAVWAAEAATCAAQLVREAKTKKAKDGQWPGNLS